MAPATVNHDVVVFILGAEGAGTGAQAAVTTPAVQLLPPAPTTGSSGDTQVPPRKFPTPGFPTATFKVICFLPPPATAWAPAWAPALLLRGVFGSHSHWGLLPLPPPSASTQIPHPPHPPPTTQPHPLPNTASLPPGFPHTASSLLAKVLPHCCQRRNHCCPRSPSHSLSPPSLAPGSHSQHSQPPLLLTAITGPSDRGLIL